jgi:hypothetical protein
MAEIVDVTTTRRSPSAAAASTATTGPCAFRRQTCSSGDEPTKPAVWKSTSLPLTARRMPRKSRTSVFALRNLTPFSASSLSGFR